MYQPDWHQIMAEVDDAQEMQPEAPPEVETPQVQLASTVDNVDMEEGEINDDNPQASELDEVITVPAPAETSTASHAHPGSSPADEAPESTESIPSTQETPIATSDGQEDTTAGPSSQQTSEGINVKRETTTSETTSRKTTVTEESDEPSMTTEPGPSSSSAQARPRPGHRRTPSVSHIPPSSGYPWPIDDTGSQPFETRRPSISWAADPIRTPPATLTDSERQAMASLIGGYKDLQSAVSSHTGPMCDLITSALNSGGLERLANANRQIANLANRLREQSWEANVSTRAFDKILKEGAMQESIRTAEEEQKAREKEERTKRQAEKDQFVGRDLEDLREEPELEEEEERRQRHEHKHEHEQGGKGNGKRTQETEQDQKAKQGETAGQTEDDLGEEIDDRGS